MIEVLSLGAGVQSTAVLLMSIEGRLPKLDYAIFADTGWEPKAVYRHLLKLERLCEENDIVFKRVSNGNIKEDALTKQKPNDKSNGNRWGSMPFHTKDGSDKGLIRRTCTDEYKIQPIEKYMKRNILKLKKYQRAEPGAIRHWFGISADEKQRVRECNVKWKRHFYPLIEMKGVKGTEFGTESITRDDCLEYLAEKGFANTPRSACVGCPFRSDTEWKYLIDNSPEEFRDAVEFDEQMRTVEGMDSELYLHRSRKPLGEIDFSVDEKFRNGQLPLFDVRQQECLGYCGN